MICMFCSACGKQLVAEARFCKACGQPAVSFAGDYGQYYERSKRTIRNGLWLLLSPIGTIIIMLILFVFGMMFGKDNPVSAVIGAMTSIFSVLAILFLFIGGIIGLVLLCRKELKSTAPADPRSGKLDASETPPNLPSWNWGAAAFPLIWGPYYKTWLCLLQYVPLLNYGWWIVMGVKGYEWAWQNNRWLSVEQFLTSQRKWRPWGIAWFVLAGLVVFMMIVISLIGALAAMPK